MKSFTYYPEKYVSLFITGFLSLLISVLSGCATTHHAELTTYTNGAAAASLSSAVSLSYSSPERSISGSGFLMIENPDKIRVVILSPLGTVYQEVVVAGDLITIVDAGNGSVYRGTTADLPVKGDLNGWRYIHWLMDIDAADTARGSGTVTRENRQGLMEQAEFKNGLLMSKKLSTGEMVRYDKYTALRGIALPLEITCETAAKDVFIIQLEEPEINVSHTEGTFTPDLSRYRVYPLSLLQ